MAERNFIKSKIFFEEGLQESIAEVPVKKLKPWPANKELKVVGKEIPRIDGYDKVSGSAKYTFDVSLPNMAFAKTLRSPHAHARIKKIDVSGAKKMKGVLAVISLQNSERIPWYWGISSLFDATLRYLGDEVACVAAESEAIAEEALKAIKVDYEILPFVTEAKEAMKKEAPKLYENTNILRGKPFEYERGNIEQGFAEADIIIEETYSTQVAVHNPTEVHGSVVNWDGNQLTVWDSTQAVFSVRDIIAESLKIPESHVRVIKKYMGGGFGSKLAAGKYTVMAALLARKCGRPVKIMLDRKEMNLAVGNRPDSVQKLKFGAKKDGTLTAMQHNSYGAIGAHPSGAGCSWPLRTIYKCANVKTEEYSVYINAGAARPFRAPGHVQGIFALEAAMDELAEKLGMDPLELRLKNYTETDPVSTHPYTSKRLKDAYLLGAEKSGWKTRNPIAGSAKGRIKTGMGMASQIWWGGGGPPAYATLKLNRDGSLRVLCGSQDLGTGTYTILAQIAGEVLEIPLSKISVTIGDTATTPYAPSSGGSVTASSITPAVRDAAEQMKKKLLQAAAVIFETPGKQLKYAGGVISVTGSPDKSIAIPQILRKIRERVLVTTGAREANPEDYAVHSFGAQFAQVEVDTDTGKISVKRIVAAHDVGRVLNKKLLENQLHGGIMMGLGFALLERRIIDHNLGAVLTTNMLDYKMPLITDVPEIEMVIVSDNDKLLSNTGVKGVGEPAMIPTAAAIANAVYNATGIRMKSLPMSPDKVLQALNV